MSILKELVYLILSIVAISIGATIVLGAIRLAAKPVALAIERTGIRDKAVGALAWLTLALCIGALCWYVFK